MEDLSDGAIYQAIGGAVVASQIFESMLVISIRLAVKQSDISVLEDVVPLKKTAFKQAVSALLKQVSGDPALEGLEDRIATLIEDRHRVVHRLFSETNYPAEVSKSTRNEILDLCLRVERESKDLTLAMMKIQEAWMEKFPETSKSLVDIRKQFGW